MGLSDWSPPLHLRGSTSPPLGAGEQQHSKAGLSADQSQRWAIRLEAFLHSAEESQQRQVHAKESQQRPVASSATAESDCVCSLNDTYVIELWVFCWSGGFRRAIAGSFFFNLPIF